MRAEAATDLLCRVCWSLENVAQAKHSRTLYCRSPQITPARLNTAANHRQISKHSQRITIVVLMCSITLSVALFTYPQDSTAVPVLSNLLNLIEWPTNRLPA